MLDFKTKDDSAEKDSENSSRVDTANDTDTDATDTDATDTDATDTDDTDTDAADTDDTDTDATDTDDTDTDDTDTVTEVTGDTNTLGDTDTGDDSEADSQTENDSDSELSSCPSGLEFRTSPVFTDLIEANSPLVGDYHDSCSRGLVIVGYRGFFRDNQKYYIHGQIQAVCARPTIHSDGNKCLVKTGDTEDLPLRGSPAEIAWSRMCPQHEIIVGYFGTTGSAIDRLTFLCAPLLVGEGHRISRGPVTPLEKAGGDGGNYDFEAECPVDQVATSSIMRTSHVIVNALGVGCQLPDLVR